MHREIGFSPSRRQLLATTGAVLAAGDVGVGTAAAQPVRKASPAASGAKQSNGALHRQKLVGFMLGHEQFTVPQLVETGKMGRRPASTCSRPATIFSPGRPMKGIAAKLG